MLAFELFAAVERCETIKQFARLNGDLGRAGSFQFLMLALSDDLAAEFFRVIEAHAPAIRAVFDISLLSRINEYFDEFIGFARPADRRGITAGIFNSLPR